MILRLFRSMWMAKAQGAISSDSPMSRARRIPLGEYFLQDIPLLLQQIAYVYNHPKELLTMLGLTNHAGAPTESLSKFAQQTVKEALALLLGLLWDISGADAILTFDRRLADVASCDPAIYACSAACASLFWYFVATCQWSYGRY